MLRLRLSALARNAPEFGVLLGLPEGTRSLSGASVQAASNPATSTPR
jgi:hypothetical protein